MAAGFNSSIMSLNQNIYVEWGYNYDAGGVFNAGLEGVDSDNKIFCRPR